MISSNIIRLSLFVAVMLALLPMPIRGASGVNLRRPRDVDSSVGSSETTDNSLRNVGRDTTARVSSTTEATSSSTESNTELPDFTSNSNTSTFSCHGKVTGYYADVKLGCRVYHFCSQIDGVDGTTYQRMSYICLEGSLFDQKDLNCVKKSDLKVQCEDAEKEYDSSNRQFDAKEESQPSYSDSLAANIMMNPITRFIAGR